MSLTLAIGIFFVVWWISLFAILPFGVKTQQENQSVIPGSTESAPTKPLLLKKVLATTLVASLISSLIYWVLTNPDITLDSIPLLPKF
jgi:predicted secreted protein